MPDTSKNKLMDCYRRLLEAEARKDELRPARLVTLVADPEWVAAVAERSKAMDAFILAARDACTAWSVESKTGSRAHLKLAS